MDTRKKIKNWNELGPTIAGEAWTIVAGAFEPCTAELASMLESNKKPGTGLLVVIEQGDSALLDSYSRAVLLAALRSVDMVMIDEGSDWRNVASRNPATTILEISDRRRRRELQELVLARCGRSHEA